MGSYVTRGLLKPEANLYESLGMYLVYDAAMGPKHADEIRHSIDRTSKREFNCAQSLIVKRSAALFGLSGVLSRLEIISIHLPY